MSKHQRKTLLPQSTSPWEWAFAAVGAVLVLGTFGYLVYFEITTSSRPTQVLIERTDVQPSGGHYLVLFVARNLSGATAAKLRIRGELRRGGAVVEANELSFDYLPGFSERQGFLYFQEDPTQGELVIAPMSYVEP